jgi:hypothetical protein
MISHNKFAFNVLALLLAISSIAFARIRQVPGDYASIQDGINECSGGDTLLIQPGTYYENINFNAQYLVLASLFLFSGDYSDIQSTIIDGGGNGSVLRLENGEDERAAIMGFTITNGYAEEGGGIHLSHASPRIIHNIIKNNHAYLHFGGGEGGGIYCEYSNSIIINNAIYGNIADGQYGGDGAGIFCDHSNPVIINNTLTRNIAQRWGGGIRCYESDPIIANDIFWGNAAEEYPQIYGEELNVTYCAVYAGWPGEGNINANPEFRDPNNEDFHLMSTAYGFPYDSPCIDAGHPGIRDAVLDSLWGLGTARSDMGTYGGLDSIPSGIDDYDQANTPKDFVLPQNYPNPFNASTTISFSILAPQQVKLQLYNIAGRKIKTLMDEFREAGFHSVIFDASDLASGIYFYRLQAGNYAESRRMVLLK